MCKKAPPWPGNDKAVWGCWMSDGSGDQVSGGPFADGGHTEREPCVVVRSGNVKQMSGISRSDGNQAGTPLFLAHHRVVVAAVKAKGFLRSARLMGNPGVWNYKILGFCALSPLCRATTPP